MERFCNCSGWYTPPNPNVEQTIEMAQFIHNYAARMRPGKVAAISWQNLASTSKRPLLNDYEWDVALCCWSWSWWQCHQWLGRSWRAEAGGWDMNRSIGHFVKGAVLKVYHMCILNIMKYKSILRCKYYSNDIRMLLFMLDWYNLFGIPMAFETLMKWPLWSSLLSRLSYSFSLGNGCSDAESIHNVVIWKILRWFHYW